MNTTRNTILLVLLFAVAAFIGGYLLKGSRDGDEASVSPTVSLSPISSAVATPYVPRLYTVTVTSAGVSPATLTIRTGDAVKFRNESSSDVWPASDPHPTHANCGGFDARRGLRTGEEYTLTFTTAKTCTYHSHLDPFNRALQGTIIVR